MVENLMAEQRLWGSEMAIRGYDERVGCWRMEV